MSNIGKFIVGTVIMYFISMGLVHTIMDLDTIISYGIDALGGEKFWFVSLIFIGVIGGFLSLMIPD